MNYATNYDLVDEVKTIDCFIEQVLLPTPRVLHPAVDHSPSSSSSSSQSSFRRPTSILTSHMTSLYMTSSDISSADSIASNVNPNANITDYTRGNNLDRDGMGH